MGQEIVVFRIEDLRYGVPANMVERVVRAVSWTPLPDAPASVAGIVNIRGVVIPVFSLRLRSGLAERPPRAKDFLIVARTRRRTVALTAEGVDGLVTIEADAHVPGTGILPNMTHLDGVVKQEDGLIIIFDLNRFLSLSEEDALDHALAENAP